MIIPTGADDPRMTTAKRQTLADFMYYSLCAGQTKAGPYGYSPLPLNLVQAGFDQLAKLKQADPRSTSPTATSLSCNNPTFDGKNLNHNVLADSRTAARRLRQGRRGPVRHRHRHQQAQHRQAAAAAAAPARGTGTGAGDAPAVAAAVAPAARPGGGDAPPSRRSRRPACRSAARAPTAPRPRATRSTRTRPSWSPPAPSDERTFGWLAVLELLALVLVPGSVRRRRARRRRAA